MSLNIRPIKGKVIVYDDQGEEETVGGVVLVRGSSEPTRLDFTVVAVHPDDHLDFGVGDTVILDSPFTARDDNHRRCINGVMYRCVEIEHVIALKE